jgi:hypothetical protein
VTRLDVDVLDVPGLGNLYLAAVGPLPGFGGGELRADQRDRHVERCSSRSARQRGRHDRPCEVGIGHAVLMFAEASDL